MNERLKTLLNSRQATVVPGAFNALTAKNAADAGFEAVYLTGAGVTNAYLGIPDVGLISLSERQARHRAPDRGAPARCGGRSLPAVGVAGSELRHEVVRVGDGHDPVADRELALERFLRGIVLDAEEPPEVHARLVEWPTDIVLDSTGLKFFGAGEWARAKHGETRRSWRKLHISVDPASSEIRTHELTGDDTADATMAGPLVAGSGGMIRRVFANGAYDGEPVTKAIREARPPNSPPEIIIPPRATSIPPPDTPHGGSEREHHAAEIASKGRMNWQKRQGYGLRALGETAMARIKRLNGGKLTARTFQSQQTEIAMQIDALNRSIRAAKPNTIRIR